MNYNKILELLDYLKCELYKLKVLGGEDVTISVPYIGATKDVDLGANGLIAQTIQLSGGTGAEGTLAWNVDAGTLDLQVNGVTYQIGQELAPLVRNATGTTIAKGTPVMFSGTLGASGRILVTPAIADGSIPSLYILGVAVEDILNGVDGYVTWFGKVRGINTTGAPYGQVWADGDIIYVSEVTAGWLTNVKPQAPNLQISVAAVVKKHAQQGTLFIRPSWRSMLADLDDVDGTPVTTTGQILVWDQARNVFDFTENINDYGKPTLRNVTAPTTFSIPSETINCTSGTYSVLLSTAVGIQGKKYTLKNSGAGVITLDANGAETIDGALSVTINPTESYTVQSDGTGWIIV